MDTIATPKLSCEEIIRRAMEFPLDEVIERYAEDERLDSETAEEHVYELRRYLALCAVNPGHAYGMKGPIDDAWHTFLIFTTQYAEFCDHVGGRFIHHYPRLPDTDTSVLRSGYLEFLADYEATYGTPAPAHLWPRLSDSSADVAGCGGCSGCGCRDCIGCIAQDETPPQGSKM